MARLGFYVKQTLSFNALNLLIFCTYLVQNSMPDLCDALHEV